MAGEVLEPEDVKRIDRLRKAISASPALSTEPEIVQVVVPIYNAFAETLRCLESVVRSTHCAYGLVLINDGSPDSRLEHLLDRLRGAHPGLRCVHRSENRGFVHTANQGMSLASGCDLVLLNSDVIVSDGWLTKLVRAAERRADIATVTPLSNNGTICSVPRPWIDNDLPRDFDVDSFAELVDTLSPRLFPSVPTGVGYCMLMSRRAIDEIGAFDEQRFGRGYGEENDFCQRAIRAGYSNIIADDTFVYHAGRASFGADKSALLTHNLALINRLYPTYEAEIHQLIAQHPLQTLHARLQSFLAADGERAPERLRRVLHLLHRGGGGTEVHARDLLEGGDSQLLSYISFTDGTAFEVEEYYLGRRTATLRFPLQRPVADPDTLLHPAYARALATMCWSLEIDLVHIHHLIHNPLEIHEIAARLAIPYVITLHDYYTVCPRYTLLDPRGARCGACTLPDQDERSAASERCMTAHGKPAEYLAAHQRAMSAFLEGAALLITPSASARRVLARAYPQLEDTITVIEHGHSASLCQTAASAPPPELRYTGGDLHVAILGGINRQKGIDVVNAVLRCNTRDQLVFHLIGGTTDPRIRLMSPGIEQRLHGSRFVNHGPYQQHEILGKLRALRIHVGLQPSIWEETFSYTLSELASLRIPAIAGQLGAQGERIDRFKLGWALPEISDPQQILEVLYQIIDRPQYLAEKVAQMRASDALRPLSEMQTSTYRLYDELIHPRSIPMAPAPSDLPPYDPGYVAYLATQVRAHEGPRDMRPPRYRAADLVAKTLRRIPLVWPLVSRAATRAFPRE